MSARFARVRKRTTGMIGRIDQRLREDMEEMLIAVAGADPAHLASLIMRVGATPPGLDEASISLLGMLPSPFACPGTPYRFVGHPGVPCFLTSVAGIAAPAPGAWMICQRTLSSNGVEMQVATDGPEVCVVFDQFTLVTPLKQMAHPAMAGIEPVGITRQ